MTPSHPKKEKALRTVLQHAFDIAYISLLEADKVTLDDQLQKRLRTLILEEVGALFALECTERRYSALQTEQYICAHAYHEILRRLKAELLKESVSGLLPEPFSARMLLLPAFETAEG